MIDAPLYSSASTEWETPPELFAQLDREFGGFLLDAAASDSNALCKKYFTVKQNGLAKPWPRGSVYVNPPYGKGVIGPWVDKAYTQSRLGSTVVMLLPFRSDTKWIHNVVVPHAKEIRFIKGRLRYRMNGELMNSAPYPSAIVVFAPGKRHYLKISSYQIERKSSK